LLQTQDSGEKRQLSKSWYIILRKEHRQRLLWRIFVLKRKEVTEERPRGTSRDVIRMTKSMGMSWRDHAPRAREREN
jgi:hypothetical protein